jgi:hypothetical protein
VVSHQVGISSGLARRVPSALGLFCGVLCKIHNFRSYLLRLKSLTIFCANDLHKLARRDGGEALTDSARTYGVSHTTIGRLTAAPA